MAGHGSALPLIIVPAFFLHWSVVNVVSAIAQTPTYPITGYREDSFAGYLIGGLLAGALIGAVVGQVQVSVLRQVVRFDHRWIWGSAAGWSVGASLGMGLAAGMERNLLPVFLWRGVAAFGVGLFAAGLLASILQYRLLREHSPAAYLWIPGYALSWLLGGSIGGLLNEAIIGTYGVFLPGALAKVAAAVAMGVVAPFLSGVVLWKLLRSPGES